MMSVTRLPYFDLLVGDCLLFRLFELPSNGSWYVVICHNQIILIGADIAKLALEQGEIVSVVARFTEIEQKRAMVVPFSDS